MSIPTVAPGKGDLVPGHKVWIIQGDLPAISANVIEARPASVTLEVSAFLAALGIPKRSVWTWRPKLGQWQQRGRDAKPCTNLWLDTRKRSKRS